MKTFMRQRKYTVAALAVLCFLIAPAVRALDEEAILAAFRDSYGWLGSAAMHISSVGEKIVPEGKNDTETRQKLRGYEDVNFFIDDAKGWHASWDSRTIDVATGKVARSESGSLRQFSRESGLFKEAGNWAVEYGYDEEGGRYLDLDPKLDGRASLDASFGCTAVVTGHSLSLSHLRIPELLESYAFQVSDGELGGAASCIVESDTEYGQIKLWLSPTENYSLQKAVFSKEYGKDLGWRGDKVFAKDYQGTIPSHYVQEIHVLKKEARGAYYIPAEVEVLTYSETGGTMRDGWKERITVSDVILNPDFAALKGFVLHVPQESCIGITNRSDMLFHTASWKEGKPAFHLEDEDLRTRGQLFLSTIEITKTSFVDKALRWLNNKLRKQDTGMYYLKNAFAFNIQTVLLLVLTVLASCWLLWRFITRLRKGFGKESCSAGI